MLENGPSSQYAAYFDVEWDPPKTKLRNTLLLPVLDDHYGRVLERREMVLMREDDHVVAFARGDRVITVVPRFVLRLAGEWADTRINLPEGTWANVLTGDEWSGVAPLAGLLARFPVALLHRTSSA